MLGNKNATEKKTFLKNTLMLYLLQFSTYFLNLAIVPYETRILGPEYYGKIGLATAIAVYFQLLFDFGFILSATADVSLAAKDKHEMGKVYATVSLSKIILCVIASIIFLGMNLVSERVREDCLLYALFILGAAINAFLPDYIYRGLERMKDIAIRTVIIKCLFTLAIFAFVKSAADYLLIPVILLFGNLLAVIWANIHVSHRLDIHFVHVKFSDVLTCIRKSSAFFLSRIASTLYSTINTLIMSGICTEAQIGYYSAADKLLSAAKGAVSPISDSMYPYMIKHKNYKLLKKILLLLPLIIAVGGVAFIFADDVCVILFGSEYVKSGNILRAMIPSAILILPSYLLGFPALAPVGLSRYANRSIYFGVAIHAVNITILALSSKITPVTLALSTGMADFCVVAYRGWIIYKNRRLFQQSERDDNVKP